MGNVKVRTSAAPWILVMWTLPVSTESSCKKFHSFEKEDAFALYRHYSDMGYDTWIFESKALSHSGIETSGLPNN